MSAPPAITEAEWPLMNILWNHPNQWLPAADIVEPVSRGRGTNHRTVRTLLSRLVKKGAVETKTEGFAYLYRAKVHKEAVTRAESKSFLARVFNGDAAPALLHLLEESRDRLSPQQLAELRALLNKKERP